MIGGYLRSCRELLMSLSLVRCLGNVVVFGEGDWWG